MGLELFGKGLELFKQGLELLSLPIFARQSYEINHFLKRHVWSIQPWLPADPAADYLVFGPAVTAVEVSLPALGHRGAHSLGAGGTSQQVEQGGVA